MSLIRRAFALAPVAVLGACAMNDGPDYAMQCIVEVGAEGHYGYPAGVEFPEVVPASDATPEGVDAVNACIQGRAAQVTEAAGSAAAGPSASSVSTSASKAVVTRTFTLGCPPAEAPAMTPAPAAAPAAPVAERAAQDPASCSLDLVGGAGYLCRR